MCGLSSPHGTTRVTLPTTPHHYTEYTAAGLSPGLRAAGGGVCGAVPSSPWPPALRGAGTGSGSRRRSRDRGTTHRLRHRERHPRRPVLGFREYKSTICAQRAVNAQEQLGSARATRRRQPTPQRSKRIRLNATFSTKPQQQCRAARNHAGVVLLTCSNVVSARHEMYTW